MEKLGIDPFIILVQIVNFGILVVVLNKFLYKPVMKAVNAKRGEIEKIEKEKAETEKYKETTEHERELVMRAAQKQKDELLADAKQQAQELLKETREKAEKQAKDIVVKAKQDARAHKKKLAASYEKDVLAAAFLVAERAISEKVTKEELAKASEKLALLKNSLWKSN